MRVEYVAPIAIPSRRANTIQVMKMCDAVRRNGHDVTLVACDPGAETPWPLIAEHYGIEREFRIRRHRVRRGLAGVDFLLVVSAGLLARRPDRVLTRDLRTAAVSATLGIGTTLELHQVPEGRLSRAYLEVFVRGRGFKGLMAITKALRERLMARYPVLRGVEAAVVPDGVDLDRFRGLPDRRSLRRELALPLPMDGLWAGYTGHLYPGRGMDVIHRLAAARPRWSFLVAGGTEEDIHRHRVQAEEEGTPNLWFAGFVPNAKLCRYQAACDVLLMPYQRRVSNSGGGDIGGILSPMKMFEYMAARSTILSSDLPVLREVLNDRTAVLLDAENEAEWVAALDQVAARPEWATGLAAAAAADAERYSWEARARRILDSAEAREEPAGQ